MYEHTYTISLVKHIHTYIPNILKSVYICYKCLNQLNSIEQLTHTWAQFLIKIHMYMHIRVAPILYGEKINYRCFQLNRSLSLFEKTISHNVCPVRQVKEIKRMFIIFLAKQTYEIVVSRERSLNHSFNPIS